MNILTSFSWEVKLMEYLQGFQSEFLDKLMSLFTECGDVIGYIIVIGIIYWAIDKNKGKKLAMVGLTSLIFTPYIKGFFKRRRPYFDHENIKCIKKVNNDYDTFDVSEQGYSFPSMHSTLASSIYGKIVMLFNNIYVRIIFTLLIFFIGVSRSYLGVHYPTDVIAGWVLGLIFLFVISFIDNKIKSNKGRNIYYLINFLIGLSGILFIREKEFYCALGSGIGFYLGLLNEEKNIKFEMPNKFYKGIIRVALGGLLFFIISKSIKYLLSLLTINNALLLLILVMFRYLISVFLIVGIYPMLFKKIKI